MRKYLLLSVLLALAACGAPPAALAPTGPTPTGAPTATAAPTATPLPTATAAPTATPLPTATPPPPTPNALAAPPVRLVIPAIELDRELVSVGIDNNHIPIVPKHDVGWYSLSARPGQGENIVLWGHVLRFKAAPRIPAPFARLKELAVGAPITLYSADGAAHQYVIVEKTWATPDQVEFILPRGRELVTLVSCIGDKVVDQGGVEMTHRLITVAAPAT